MKSVDARHQAFALSYIANNFNATEAYREVYGGTPSKRGDNDSGSNILNNPDVQEMVAKLTEKYLSKFELAAQNVMREMSIMAFSDIRDYMKYDEAGNVAFKSSESLGDEARAIKKMRVKEVSRGDNTTRTIEFELHDKNKPMEMISKAMGLFKKPAIPEGEKDKLSETQAKASDVAYNKRIAMIADKRKENNGK